MPTTTTTDLERWAGLRRSGFALALLGALLVGCSDTTDDDPAATADSVLEDPESALDDAGEQAEELVDDVADSIVENTDEIDEQSAELAQVLRDNDLNSLAGAVEQVDLSAIVGDGEFTFFAPGDEAFLALEGDALADLLADPEQLATVLRNHAVSERIDAGALSEATSVTSEAGNELAVTSDGSDLMVDGVTVVNADIDAGNGVIHVVDQLIMP